ncbi:S8 family peptidase [Clostridium sp.]|uniref:S8 family peptidase n=1 Tax=Clostridium sp. TaxID=1506 RepID=UPI002FC7266E
MKFNKSIYYEGVPRESSTESLKTLTDEEFRNYYFSKDYEVYFMEYVGDIRTAISKIDYADIYATDKFYTILFVRNGMLNTLLENVPEIISVQPNGIYTLSELIVDTDISKKSAFYEKNIPYNGEGVIVGIIGTGIDYLNPRFINEKGESRIVAIWDQTLRIGPSPFIYPYGTEFRNENINNAIKTKQLGNSPYAIVPHRDEVGYGTAIAGIIGGSLGEDDILSSIAPKCQFAVVKLAEAQESPLRFAGVVKDVSNVYQTTDVASAIRYLAELQAELKKPMVVYLSLGTNFGGRNGDTVLERYIDNLVVVRDINIAMDTGNQGTGITHTSGIIEGTGRSSDILLNVAPLQSMINMQIYIRSQDIVSISITSPNGNTLTNIPDTSQIEHLKYFSIEENNISLEYSITETISGNLMIDLLLTNTEEGIWKISLLGVDIINGSYNAWIPQSDLLYEGTQFLSPDPRTTLLTPCGASNIMSTSYYNQINNTVAQRSGKGFPFRASLEPIVTIGGFNLLTTGLNDTLILGTGGAMAGAILSGAVALILQWWVTEGNIGYIYSSQLRSILISSTVKDPGKSYPNIEWGFGKLSFYLLSSTLQQASEAINERDIKRNYLYINIPMELFNRLKL